MWFLVALSCSAVMAAQPNNKGQWEQVGRTPIRPRWEQNFGNPAFPDPVGPLYPDGPEQQGQYPSTGSQDLAFGGQNGGDTGYEPGLTGPGSGLWNRWGEARKPQRNGRAGRPSYKPMHPTQAPAESPVNPIFGKPLSPNMMANRQFIPIFKADNITMQNISTFHLKEGENVFLLPKGRGQPPKKGGVNRPQELGYGQGFSLYGPQPYMKIRFNPNATPRISFEYGITQLFPSFMKTETENDLGAN